MFNNNSTIAPPPNDTLKGIAKQIRGKDAKRQSLLRFGELSLYNKFVDVLSLFKRNILISPLDGEKKFLSELCELRNFRESKNLKYSCSIQHETVLEPSPAFVMLTKVRKRLLPLTKREGLDSVINSDFKSKISTNNENNFPRKELSALVPQYLSNFYYDMNHSPLTTHYSLIPEMVFSRFTSHFSRKRTAFTLAEVLITLGIIGVISALTLPSLIVNYQKKQTVQQLKTAYSLLSQAVEQSISENGEIDNWDYTLNTNAFNETYILPYLKIVKKCDGGKCIKTDNFNGYYELNGNKYTRISGSYILANGMILMADLPERGFLIYMIDLNGNKKPNIMGKDIFAFYLLNHQSPNSAYKPTIQNLQAKLYIGGIASGGIPHHNQKRSSIIKENIDRSCNKNSANGGLHGGIGSACAAVIMKDNWEISKDYPW